MDGYDIPEHPMQRREWIKFQLRLRGTTLSAIARELGVSRQALRQALTQSYPKMECAIAAKLGRNPEDIWPERYARRRTRTQLQDAPHSFQVNRLKHNTATRPRNGR